MRKIPQATARALSPYITALALLAVGAVLLLVTYNVVLAILFQRHPA